MPNDLILGEQLRVRFHWVEDRFAHAIELKLGPETVTLLTSCEGTSQQRWPPSPPLQQLHVAELAPDRRAALLLGMAGNSHWSLSVEAERSRPELIFDVACRVHRRPEQLGSRYRGFGDVAAHSTNELTLKPHSAQERVTVTASKCEGETRIRCEGDDLVIACCAAGTSLPQTLRWKYRVALG